MPGWWLPIPHCSRWKSLCGEEFDENFILKNYIGPGILSRENAGLSTMILRFSFALRSLIAQMANMWTSRQWNRPWMLWAPQSTSKMTRQQDHYGWLRTTLFTSLWFIQTTTWTSCPLGLHQLVLFVCLCSCMNSVFFLLFFKWSWIAS